MIFERKKGHIKILLLIMIKLADKGIHIKGKRLGLIKKSNFVILSIYSKNRKKNKKLKK
jgi:hypothetical protein